MRQAKLKRKVYKKIPYIFFSFALLGVLTLLALLFSKEIISKQTFFISPLARGSVTNQGELEELLNKNNISFSAIETSENFYNVKLKDQGTVTIDSKKSLQQQISSLQLILSRLTIEGKKFKKLDLRYELPIIEF